MRIKALFSAAILQTSLLLAQDWNLDANGNWGTAVNWLNPATVPNAVGATANFGAVITAARLVTVDISPIAGILTFNNANSYTIGPPGPLTLSNGTTATITVTTGTHSITVPLSLTSNLTLTQNSAGAFTLGGVIGGAGSVTTAGTGTVILSAVNTYTGGTNVGGGILQMGIANAIPPTGPFAVTGGPVNFVTFNQSIGPLSGTGNINMGTASLTTTTAASTTYSGSISGSGSLTLGTGSTGTLILTSGNGYTGGTVINGGTLQLNIDTTLATGSMAVNSPGTLFLNNTMQIVSSLSGNGSINLGSTFVDGEGLDVVQASGTSTFSGIISGANSVGTDGAFTLILGGQNTFTGELDIRNISGGSTVQLTANNGLSPLCLVLPGDVGTTFDISPTMQQSIGGLSGEGNVILGSAQLTLNPTSIQDFGQGTGVISGLGSVVMAGPSVQNFSFNNTYSGGTTVTGGFLTISVTNALFPGSTLVVNAPGTFSLLGNNQTVGDFSGTGTVVLGGGIFTAGATNNTTFSGVITGPGTLIKMGSSTLTLLGPNTNPFTTVMAGTLQGTTTSLQGMITNMSTVTFNQSFAGTFTGTLVGGGTLNIIGGGSVTLPGTQTEGTTNVLSGALILGSSATLNSMVNIAAGGTLSLTGPTATIVGNVVDNGIVSLGLNTLNITGNYIQAAGSSLNLSVTPTTNGFLPVAGSVAITGSPGMSITPTPGIYQPSQIYTLIRGSSVTGTYSAPTFTNPFFQGTLIYSPTTVQLQLMIAPIGNVIKGGNAGAIAQCINIQEFPQESDLLPIIQTLIFLPLEEVRDALKEMQPSQLKALARTEENNLVLIRSGVSQRCDDYFMTRCNQAISDRYNWSLWSTINGDYLKQNHHSQNIGYRAVTGSATVGIDTALYDNIFFGLAGAYNYSWLDWDGNRGDGSISSYYAGPYVSFLVDELAAFNFSVLGTKNDFHATRHIKFPTVDQSAKSEHDGYGLISHADLGFNCNAAYNVTLAPFAGVDYIYLHEQPFTEHDAGSLNLRIQRSKNTLLRSELGMKIAKCVSHTSCKWTHDLKVSWIYQHMINGQHLKAQFTEVDCIFSVAGLTPNHNFIDIATGISGIFIDDKLSFSIRYEGKFGENVSDNAGYFELLFKF